MRWFAVLLTLGAWLSASCAHAAALNPNITYKFVNPHSGLCLDLPGGSSADGARLQLWNCNQLAPQRYEVHATTVVTSAQKCMDVTSANTANGTAVQQWTCNGLTQQQVVFKNTHDNIYTITFPFSGKCLDVPGAATTPGTPLQEYGCNGTVAQEWAPLESTFDAGSTVQVANAGTQKCVDVTAAGSANGTLIQEWDCDNSTAQGFNFSFMGVDANGYGYYNIVNTSTAKCVDVSGVSQSPGARVWLWQCLGAAQTNQQWQVLGEGGGQYKMLVRHSGQALDLYAGIATDGTAIQQWPDDGASAQRWQLQPQAGADQACGDGVCSSSESYLSCSKDCTHRVGTFYSGWHMPAYNATLQLQQKNLPVISIEALLRSRIENGSPTGTGMNFTQLLRDPGLEGVASMFYYQHFPAPGPYCIVEPRNPGDVNYNAAHEGSYGQPSPSCPMAQQILQQQAAQMVAAGIDYVVVDGTNIPTYDPFSDAIQLRPFEMLVQVWSALRAQGIATPQVAMWQRFPMNPTLASDSGDWSYKHVLNIYNDPAYANILMRDAGTGKLVYFYPDVGDFDPGFINVINSNGGQNNLIAVPMWAYGNTPLQWSFMSACTQGAEIDDTACNQPWTHSSVIGSQMAVVPSYQMSRASVPFQASGVYNGLTLRKQFATAFAAQPDYLLLSSWNETVAQPGSFQPAMGLETDSTAGNTTFVDNYGIEFSRDIEPSQEYGSLVYDLVSSCLRVYRSGTSTCSAANEACCQGGNFSDRYARFNGPQGEFVLYASGLGAGTGRAALYSCSAGSNPFFSMQANCEGQTSLGMVGYISTVKGGETLRSLWRCVQSGTAVHSYSLTAACPAGQTVEAVLGYVR